MGGGDQGQENWNKMIRGDIAYYMQYYAMFMPSRKGQVDCKVPSLGIVSFQRKRHIHPSQEKFLIWAFDSTNKDEDFFTTWRKTEWGKNYPFTYTETIILSTLGKDRITASHWAKPNGVQQNYFYYYAHMKFPFPT